MIEENGVCSEILYMYIHDNKPLKLCLFLNTGCANEKRKLSNGNIFISIQYCLTISRWPPIIGDTQWAQVYSINGYFTLATIVV